MHTEGNAAFQHTPRQAITWIKVDLFSTGLLETNFADIHTTENLFWKKTF